MKLTANPSRIRPTGRGSNWREWVIPTGLILLSLVPALAGSVRLVELSSEAEVTAANARFFASPLPVVSHIISVMIYSLLGAFQFAPKFRRTHRRWHRTAGWLILVSGIVAAVSGLWMTQFYPWPEFDGQILYGLRLVFGTLMLFSLIMAFWAARQRLFIEHGVWMIRAYAIGLGAGTQVLTHLPWFLFPEIQGELSRAMMMGAGWLINLLVAEWIIARAFARQRRPLRARR